jgi:hypothetical protein
MTLFMVHNAAALTEASATLDHVLEKFVDKQLSFYFYNPENTLVLSH